MINPWQDLFNAWVDTYLKPQEEEEMKPYEVKLTTTATFTIQVDAYNEDDAIEEAYSMIDRKEVEFDEWEVEDVSVEYPDND
jgi:ribosomal protein L20A (L18A)